MLDHTLEDYPISNKLVNVRSEEKIFFSLFTLLIVICIYFPFLLLLILLTMSSITIWSGVRIRHYLGLLTSPLAFLLPSILVLAFLHGSEPVLTFSVIGMQLTIMREGLKLGTLLTMKSIAGISCLLFMGMTTPIAEIFNTLKKLWMPEIFIELSFMMYKLIFDLFDEIESTKKAQNARLGYLRGNRIKSLALLLSSILVNSLKGVEKKEKALEARCYAGKMPSLDLGKSKNKERRSCVTSSFILMFSFDTFLLVMAMIMEL